MRDSITVFDMPRPHDSHHERLTRPVERRLYCLGHRPVPELLAFYKPAESRIIPGSLALLPAVALVFRVDRQQIIEIGRTRRGGRRHALPLILRNAAETLRGNRPSQTRIDVE